VLPKPYRTAGSGLTEHRCTVLLMNNSPLSERQCLNTVPPYIDCPSTLGIPRDASCRFCTHSQNASPDGPPKENGGLLGSGRVGVQRTIHRRRGRQAPAPTQLGGWMNPMGSDRARNPCNFEPSGYKSACNIPRYLSTCRRITTD